MALHDGMTDYFNAFLFEHTFTGMIKILMLVTAQCVWLATAAIYCCDKEKSLWWYLVVAVAAWTFSYFLGFFIDDMMSGSFSFEFEEKNLSHLAMGIPLWALRLGPVLAVLGIIAFFGLRPSGPPREDAS
jgi:hypothetical protein